jgi:hypothetical protein
LVSARLILHTHNTQSDQHIPNDTTVLLRSAGQKSGNINKREDWNIEGIQESHEACSLYAGIDIEATSKLLRLVSDDTNGTTLEARETNDNVLGVVGHDLEEVFVVDK